jgi:hypothetical protein
MTIRVTSTGIGTTLLPRRRRALIRIPWSARHSSSSASVLVGEAGYGSR